MAKARTVRDDDLRAPDAFALGLARHLLIGVDAGLGFRLPRTWALPDPFQLARKGSLASLVLAGLLLEPLGLLLQPGGIIPLPRDSPPAIELQDPASDLVQEIAVMGDDQ